MSRLPSTDGRPDDSTAAGVQRRLGGPIFAAVAATLAWSLTFAALQWSVVRFETLIVACLVVSAVFLGVWQWARPAAQPFTATSLSVIFLLGVVAAATIPTFSYLPGTAEKSALASLMVGAAAAAVLLHRGRRGPTVAAAVGVTAYVVASVIAIVTDRAPRIDVWVILQQASDGLRHGQDMYAMTWTGSPGIKDAFTYLPWTAVLLAPGRWLFGDVRWALLFWSLVAAAGMWRLASRPGANTDVAGMHADERPSEAWHADAVDRAEQPERQVGSVSIALVAVPLLFLAPGTLTQVDQAWTEPLLLAGLVWWAVLVRRGTAGSTWAAVVPLALACASKQHLALLLPVLAVWRPFGFRRTVGTAVLAGLLVLPWVVASPSDFIHDTISLLVSFHPIKFANTLYLLALNKFGVTLPFWLTGLVVLGALAAVTWTVWRRQPTLAQLLRWLALLLLIANLVNKQAFYNQFWLSAALIAVALAATDAPDRHSGGHEVTLLSRQPGTSATAPGAPAPSAPRAC